MNRSTSGPAAGLSRNERLKSLPPERRLGGGESRSKHRSFRFPFESPTVSLSLRRAICALLLFIPAFLASAESAPDAKLLKLALNALRCAQASGMPQAQRLGVIDYTQSSTAARFWVLDLETGKALFTERVAHGKGSGEAKAVRFSNVPESYTSSLGLFRTLESYHGQNGYSLRLQGLETGVNDKAHARAIVIHGADYVSDNFISRLGRLGRSFGCPAVRKEIARPLIDSLKQGQYLFAYAADAAWLKTSSFLSCPSQAPETQSVRFELEDGNVSGRPAL